MLGFGAGDEKWEPREKITNEYFLLTRYVFYFKINQQE